MRSRVLFKRLASVRAAAKIPIALLLASCSTLLGADFDRPSASGVPGDGGAGVGTEAGCVAAGPTFCAGKCGSLQDSCGAVVDCGGCAAGLTCGGGGPNVCGSGACAPSCAGKPCNASDGCASVCNTACGGSSSGSSGGAACTLDTSNFDSCILQ